MVKVWLRHVFQFKILAFQARWLMAFLSTCISQSASEQGMRLSDAIKLSVDGRIPVGVTLQMKSRQEIHFNHRIQEPAIRVHCDHFAIFQVPR